MQNHQPDKMKQNRLQISNGCILLCDYGILNYTWYFPL